jgi:NAD(P)-dependent dehydrogenase (short-subunit alcohol dehydrogenase family)
MTTTFITGANKGLGHETARRLIERGHTVLLGARDPGPGAAAARDLGARFVPIDVTDDASVAAAAADVAATRAPSTCSSTTPGSTGPRATPAS